MNKPCKVCEGEKEKVINLLKMFSRITKPWKERQPLTGEPRDYASGWNDCVKEVGKRQKKFLKNVENL